MAPWRRSKVAGAIPGVADVVDLSTLGDVDPADGPVVPDGYNPATLMVPCLAVDLANAPLIQDGVIQRSPMQLLRRAMVIHMMLRQISHAKMLW